MDKILLSSPTMHTEEIQFVQEAFDRNWVAPLGFNCDGFEEEIISCLRETGYPEGAELHTLATTSGTSALHLAIKLAGIHKGDTVLCSDMTFCASVNPVTYEGAQQVFVDSEYETWNMDPEALEKAFQKYPEAKIVVLTQLYGTPSKMDEILDVCKKHNAVLVEDAAEAITSRYKNQACGTFGDMSALSFNGNKLITTSGGGMLVTKSKEQRDKALFWATQAREPAPWYQHEETGYNYRMSNIVAGIGRGQLLHVLEHRQLKEDVYNRYKKGLEDLPVKMNPYLPDSRPNFWLSSITIENGKDPMELMRLLSENNIESRPIWKAMHLQPIFRGNDFVSVKDRPVDEDIFARGLCLPSDIKMTPEQQDLVIRVIRGFFQ